MKGTKKKNHGKVWLHEGYTQMEKNAKGNRETLPNPFLILKPVAEAKLKPATNCRLHLGNMATTSKYVLVF